MAGDAPSVLRVWRDVIDEASASVAEEVARRDRVRAARAADLKSAGVAEGGEGDR
jgi:hypothetical protein